MLLMSSSHITGAQLTLSVTTLQDTKFSPDNATASITIARDGDVTVLGNGSTTPGAEDWIEPRDSTVGDDYEVRCTVNSGDNPTFGTTASWLALTVDRTFGWTTVGDQTLNVDVDIEIRRASTGAVLVSRNMTGIVTRTTV